MFKNEKTKIRLIERSDYKMLFKMIELNRNRLHLDFPKTVDIICDIKESKKFISWKIKQSKNREAYFFVIVTDPGKEVIGSVFIKTIDWTIPKCELAYFIDREHEGMGIVSKSVQSLIKYSFSFLKMKKIFLRINPENEGSRKVAIQNKFVKEGCLRREYKNGRGKLVDMEYYGLLRS